MSNVKQKRHKKIIEIITENDIDTQDELINRLRIAGYDVTQATASRDIHDLKLVKISTENKGYKYALSSHSEMHISNKYMSIIRETIIGVDYANNTVVLRTYAGMAQAAAAAIDGMKWSEIVGTIAGDDTIFVLMRDNETAIELVAKIRQTVKPQKYHQ